MEDVSRNKMIFVMAMFYERQPPALRPSFHLGKGSQTKRD